MAQLSNQDDFIKTALRLPKAVHASIQSAATQSGRSMNAEIIARLERSFADEPLRAGALDLNGLLSAGLILSTGEEPTDPAAQFLLDQAREAAQRVAKLAYRNSIEQAAAVNPEKSQK